MVIQNQSFVNLTALMQIFTKM